MAHDEWPHRDGDKRGLVSDQFHSSWGIGAFPFGLAEVNTSPLFNDSWMLGKGASEQEAGFTFLKYLAVDKGA